MIVMQLAIGFLCRSTARSLRETGLLGIRLIIWSVIPEVTQGTPRAEL
jgi:hypothetical protein